MTSKKFFLLFILAFFLCVQNLSKAEASNSTLPTITVINMIRGSALGRENVDLLPRLKAQWQDTKNHDISATWLWQYSALINENLTSYAKKELTDQEFGLFLEVDRNFTKEADVLYRGRGPWYFSDGLFTFSYDLSERKKLIDTIFAKFKYIFGYYPKTVGAWWVDANSLSYMQKKYGITSSLRAADQYDLDVYSIWGTPWSIPYMPSQENAGIPARTFRQAIPIVITQWAARDPFKAYGKNPGNSTYSMQDYEMKQYDQEYFNHLSSIFLKASFDQIVIGLENDGDEKSFTPGSHYNNLLEVAANLRSKNKVNIRTAMVYADDFLKRGNVLPSSNYFLADEYQGNGQAFWYNAPNYRIGINKEGDKISVIDLRDYRVKNDEEFAFLPNSQSMLRLYISSLIDTATFQEKKILLTTSSQPLTIKKINGNVVLSSGDQKIGTFNNDSFSLNKSSLALPLLSKNQYIYPFSLLLMVTMVYIVGMRKRLAKKDQVMVGVIYMLFLIVSFDFQSFSNTLVFDNKMALLSSLFPLIPIASAKAYIAFFVVPYAIFLTAHMVIALKFPTKKLILLAPGVALLVLYAHLPYFPLDKTTYTHTALGLGLVIVMLCAAFIVFYLKTKKKMHIAFGIAGVLLLIGVFALIIFLSRTRIVIPEFELQALKAIQTEKKDILYIYPTDRPIYKAVKPSLLDNYLVDERLSGQDWKTIYRTEGKLILNEYDDKLVFVPRFIGSTIFDEEIKEYGLKKIFDNSQIAIYE